MGMTAHGAQPDNTPDALMLQLLEVAMHTLLNVSHAIGGEKKPKRAVKDQLRRDLCGVIGDLETVCKGLS